MKTVHFHRRLAGALGPIGALLVATPAWADLVLNFNNDRPDASSVPAYITFTGAPAGGFDATNILTGAALQEGISYSLSTLAAGVDVTQYTSGRVFVSLGAGLTGLSAANNYAPNFLSPSLPNFTTRMDKYEITYGVPASGGAPTGGANLSSTDFFGIPLKLQTRGGSQPTTLTWNYNNTVNTASVFQSLGALENYQTDTVANTLGALVPNGSNGVTINTPGGPLAGVVRIIAPSSTNQPTTGSSTPYPNIGAYAASIQTNGISASISGQNGQFAVNTGPFQNYSMTGTISNGTTKINGALYPSGELVLFGNVTNPTGVGTVPLTVTVSSANLQSFVIYGSNPAYNVTVGANVNKVVQKIVADYFSGLNFGLIGSTAPNPNNPGQTIGNSPSWTWYGNKPNGGGPKPLPLSDAYEAAQSPGSGFYNAYASYLNNSSAPVTDAYGFPYTDRLASPLASLDDNTVLTLTILSDDSGSPPSGWVITVPTPNTQTFADLLVGPTPSSMLTVDGGGTAIFSAENTYSGGTTIIDGTTVEVTNSNPGVSSSIGTGLLTLDNGVLEAGANNLTFSNAVTLTSNGGTFDTNGNALTWNGVISGDGGLTKVGAGTLILGSTNTYAGGTLVDGGTLGIGANGALGSGGVTMQPGTILQFEASGIAVANSIVLNADATFDTGSNTDAISGVISGPGALSKIGSGTLILVGENTYAGGTLLDFGTLGIASNGALGAGAVTMAPGTTLEFETSGLTLANGIVLVADPTIDTGANTDAISGVISGSGSLDKIGSGTLILTAANTYSGATDVQEGTLALRGSLASTVTVESGATLGGTGSVGGLIANSGAMIAPGVLGAYATFTVTGEAAFAAGSTFGVNISAAGQNDKLVTTGATTLSGGTVAVNGASGTYLPAMRWTLVTAEGGVSGTFSSISASGDLATLAFLAPMLSYDADDVYLGFAAKPFASVAQTPNQAATALALQAQPVGSPLYNALISQTTSGALSAFNALSGEIHASAVGAALDDTRLPRQAVLDRLAETYGAPPPGGAKTVKTYDFSTPTQVYSAWAQGFELLGASRRQRQCRDGGQQPRRFYPGRRCDAVWPLSPWRRGRLRQFEHLGPGARLVREHLGDLYRALRRRQPRRAAIARRRLLRQQPLRPRSRGVVPWLLPDGGIGLRRRHGRGFRRGRLADRRRGADGLDRVGRAVRRRRRRRSPYRELRRNPRPGRARWRIGERQLRDYDAWAARRHDDVRNRAIEPERHDRLAARLRRADAERDAGLRQPSLDPVLDRRGADRARRARPRTRNRPAPDLEPQTRPLLFRAPGVGRQRQRRQGQARGDFLKGRPGALGQSIQKRVGISLRKVEKTSMIVGDGELDLQSGRGSGCVE